METDTPFVRFWAALNQDLKASGFPEMHFGDAKTVWEEARSSAQRLSMIRARKGS